MNKVCDCGGWRRKIVTCEQCGRVCCADCYDYDEARPSKFKKLCLGCKGLVHIPETQAKTDPRH